MEQQKIDRINFLARKAKESGLTDAEREEQKTLRAAYIAEFRASVSGMLENTYIQYPDGEKKKLERREKKEKSCGAVIFRRAEQGIETLLLRHNGGHWAFAKGHVEGSETEEETALREIREETALSVTLDTRFRRVNTYSPKPGVRKDVIYFVAWHEGGEAAPQLSEISELCWLSPAEALERVTHESDRAILRAAVDYLNRW